MSAPPPRLVCFDLGGVVVRICQSWADGCDAAGVPVRSHPRLQIGEFGDLHGQHQTGAIDIRTYASRLSERLDGVYSVEEILAIHGAWMVGVYTGIDAIIDRLHELGVITAALSNTDHEHWLRLPEFEAVKRLGHHFASHELGLIKPDPAIYQEVERRLDIQSHEILFFDDLEENVAAAKDAGWRAVQIDPHRETAPQIVASLHACGLAVGP